MMWLVSLLAGVLGIAGACTSIDSRLTTQFALRFTTVGNATIAIGPSRQLFLDVGLDRTCTEWDTTRICFKSRPVVTISFEFSNNSAVRTVVTGRHSLHGDATVVGEVKVSPAGGFADVTFCAASYHSPMWFDCSSNNKWTSIKSEWCCMKNATWCLHGPTTRTEHRDTIGGTERTFPPQPALSQQSGASATVCVLSIHFLYVSISLYC